MRGKVSKDLARFAKKDKMTKKTYRRMKKDYSNGLESQKPIIVFNDHIDRRIPGAGC